MASEQKESMDVNVNNNLHQKIQDELKLLEEKNTTVIAVSYTHLTLPTIYSV